MAKRRKNSTALFEVIHAGKFGNKSPTPPAAALKTPRWWFKGLGAKDKQSDSVEVDPNDPTANVTAATLFQRARHVEPVEPVDPPAEVAPAPEPAPTPSAPAVTVAPAPAPTAAPVVPPTTALVPVHVPAPAPPPPSPSVALRDSNTVAVAVSVPDSFDDSRGASSGDPAAESTAIIPVSYETPLSRWGTAVPGVQVGLDTERQEVTLRMRYTAALVSAFAVLVVIGLAYVLGRHMAAGPTPVAAKTTSSTNQIRRGPAQGTALDVSERTNRTLGVRPRADGDGAIAPLPRPVPGSAGNGAYADAPIAPNGTAQRMNNMNYLLIQSYPPERRQTALEVRDYLVANNIHCTVEKGSRHALPGWYAVVGTRGFPPKFGQTAEYNAYVEAIKKAGRQFPIKSKFDEVNPMPFKWAE